MISNCTASEGFEISPRFRQSVEERIARLERDAETDEAVAGTLVDGDHIRGRCGWWPQSAPRRCA